VTVARLLSADPRVDRDLKRIMEAADTARISYRMTEGNSCYRGGKPGMSNAFCSALWAADYMLKLANHGCAGVNLHGGGSKQIRDSLGGHLPGELLEPGAADAARDGSFYTPIAGSRESGFRVRPVFYGMKLAGLLAGGQLRQVDLPAPQAITAYAADMETGHTGVVVINKDDTSDFSLRLTANRPVTVWRLEAPSLTATAGVTLAGAPIDPAVQWKPKNEERAPNSAGRVVVNVRAASALALFFDLGK
jgi:hypothetical protein